MTTQQLAQLVIDILDKKANKGCRDKGWHGFQNGNGEEVSKDIEQLINTCKQLTK